MRTLEKLIIALSLLLLPVSAVGQVATTGFHRVNQVIARGLSGVTAQVVPYASVYVTDTVTGATATIYSDPTLHLQIVSGIVNSDASGNYQYYIPLNYCVNEQVSAPGQGTFTTKNICQNGGGAGTVTNITTTSPITGGPITTTGTIGLSTVPITLGGTGATTAAGAWANITGSVPVTIAQGGTGATTASGAWANITGGTQTGTGTSQVDTFPGAVEAPQIYTSLDGADNTGSTDVSTQVNAAVAAQLQDNYGSSLDVTLPPGEFYAPSLSNLYGVEFEGPGIILKQINQTQGGYPTVTQAQQNSYSYAHRMVFGQEYLSHWMAVAERNIATGWTLTAVGVTSGGSYSTCPTSINIPGGAYPNFAGPVTTITCSGSAGNYAITSVSVTDGGNYLSFSGTLGAYGATVITPAVLVGTWAIATPATLNVTFSGDSTTYGVNTDGDYAPSNVFKLAAGVIPGLTTTNAGQPGANSAAWLSTYLPADQATNPDVYVVRWGVNDNSFGVNGEIANIRAGLACIRNGCTGIAAKTVDQETIILETPNSVNNYPEGRDPIFEEQLRAGFAQAARDYQAVFIDLYGLMADNDFTVQTCMMDWFGSGGVTGGYPQQHVHPGDCKSPIYNQPLIDALLGPLNNAFGQSVQNIPGLTASPIASAPPSKYAKGVTLNSTTLANGWPFAGQAITISAQDGTDIVQFNAPYAGSTTQMSYRTAQNATTWNGWASLPNPTGFTAGYGVSGSGSIGTGPYLALGTNGWYEQVGAANSFDLWGYNGGWLKLLSIDNSGNISNQTGSVVIPAAATGSVGTVTGKVVLANGTPGAGKYIDGAAGTWTTLPSSGGVTGSGTSGSLAAWSGTTSIGNASASQVASLLASLTGCTTANYFYSPASGNCQAGGSSSVGFDAITGATNTTAAMVVGSGASLATSGTGTITATGLSGTPALPNGTTATSQGGGVNNTDVATEADIQSSIAAGGTLPYTPLAAYYAFNASGTTLTDSSGNGYNGTFGYNGSTPVAANQPTIVNSNAIQFKPTPGVDQWVGIPCAAVNNLGASSGTILMYFKSNYPPSNEWAEQTPYMLGDQSGYGIVSYPSRFGTVGMLTSTTLSNGEPTDRMIGNSFFYAINSGGVWNFYPYGHGATSTLYAPAAFTFTCSSGYAMIGHLGSSAGQAGNYLKAWSGNLYAMLTFTQSLTLAQAQQANAYVQYLLAQHGVTFSEPYYPSQVVYDGDSRTAFYLWYQLSGSRPWAGSTLVADSEQFWNLGRSGITVSTINSSFNAIEAPLLNRYASASRTVILDAIINDIHTGTGCTSTSSCATLNLINTYGNDVNAAVSAGGSGSSGITSVYATPLTYNAANFTSAMETVRETTEAAVQAAVVAGTFPFSGVDDIYNDPIAATQSTPNVYATSGAAALTVNTSTYNSSTSVYVITLASNVPQQYCYPGSSVTLSGMTPSGWNGTFVMMLSNYSTGAPQIGGDNLGCFGNAFTIATTSGITNATVLGNATFPNGQVIAVASATYLNVYLQNSRIVTTTFTGAVPSWECYPGAIFNMAGNTPSAYNAVISLISCSGSTITYSLQNPAGALTVAGTGTYEYNPQWFYDGIHENGVLVNEMASQEAASKQAAQGRMKQCTTITKTIPWQVVAATQATTAALTQTIPLLWLQPGWNVCSVAVAGTTAFAGTTTLTATIGDSAGTATQYASSFNMMATAPAPWVPYNSAVTTPSTAGGTVSLYLTSTGSNIAAVNAGGMTVSIGVVKP